MSSHRGWTHLAVRKPGVPTLFFRYTASAKGYDMILSDLTNMWQERLSTTDVARRAERDECSINPGDDQDQFRILFTKIEEGLCHVNGARVDFRESHSDDLRLIITAILPHPLPTFKWHACLAKESQVQITNELMTPLLSFACQQQQQITFLTTQLRDKDHVIDRILQKMESSNTDLGAIFPGMSGIRKSQKISQREQFAKHVKGLAPFKPGVEKEHSDRECSNHDIFAILGHLPVPELKQDPATPAEDWWREPIDAYITRPQQSMDLDDDETDDDLDFQVSLSSEKRVQRLTNIQLQTQPLPSHLKDIGNGKALRSNTRPAKTIPSTTNSTPDTDVLDGEATLSSPSRAASVTPDFTKAPSPPRTQTLTQIRAPAKRLGAIGGRSQRSSQPAASQSHVHETPISSTEHGPGYGRRTKDSNTPPPASIPPSTLVSPAKRRLGAIGGRRGSSQLTQLSTQRQPSPTPTPSEGDKKIDGIHPHPLQMRRDRQDQSNMNEEPVRSRVEKYEANSVEPPQPRETSEERANQKRGELKRQLEAQAKAPTKKKRKF